MYININGLVGPQKDTWTKFFALSFVPEKDEPPMSNMRIWVGLRKLLLNNNLLPKKERWLSPSSF